jgi:predicted Zn-dependent protease
MTKSRHRQLLPIALCLSAMLSPVSINAAQAKEAPVPRGATDREIQLGKKSAEELEKNPKIKFLDGSKDPVAKALIDKVNAMAKQIGKVSARPDIKYIVKIIDDKDLNAFTLPNGHIYLFSGLLEFAGSDDEVAAVISHEIGHNARLHALRGQAKAKKLSWVGLAAMAAMLSGKGGADVAQFSQYLLMGIMNGYSEDYEQEADVAAIEQLQKTNYNPSALVTFMQRLSQEEKRRPEWEPGIFRTHPPTGTRATAAITEIEKRGLPFNPREVTGAPEAKVIDGKEKDRIAITYGKELVAEFATTPATIDNVRVQATVAATRINELMKSNLKMHEISADGDKDGARLLARGTEVLSITPADAKLQNLTPLAAAQKWRDSFRRLFWRETLNGKM